MSEDITDKEKEEIEDLEKTEVATGIKNDEVKYRPCPHCHQMMPIKDPWKALFRKPTLSDWITLFLLIMVAVAAWAYQHDTEVCRDYVANIDQVCATRGIVPDEQPETSNWMKNESFYIPIAVKNGG